MPWGNVFWLMTLFFAFVNTGINIIQQRYPWYCNEGDSLTLVCQSDQRSSLTWTRQTAGNTMTDIKVNPGSGFSSQVCSDEPSGRTKSTLMKNSLGFADRGTYACRNQLDENYAVYISILSVLPKLSVINTTHVLVLQCRIDGFENNPTSFETRWTFERESKPGPVQVTPSARYNISTSDTLLQLQISKPTANDVGTYNCSFYFATTVDVFTYSGSISVTDSDVKNVISGQETSFRKTSLLFSLVALFFISMQLKS